MSKKYFWIKLPKTFFHEREIKKLRNLPDGDTLIIIYLKMLLQSADKGGYIEYDVTENFLDELAFEIDEDTEKTAACLSFLQENKLLIKASENKFFLPAIQTMTGKDSMKKENHYSADDFSFPPMTDSETDDSW